MEQHDFLILIALLQGPRHGYAIVQDIAAQTGGRVRLGTSTLYAALKRMAKAGLIEETDRPAREASDDERRRYYAATALGRAAARDEARRIRQLDDLASAARLLDRPARSTRGRS